MPELRKDPIIGRWVIIATERAKRPSDYKRAESNGYGVGLCALCQGNETMTPPEVMAYRDAGTAPNSPGWWTRVVPNKFPALQKDGSLDRTGVGMYDMMNGIGIHEVIVDTPDHTGIIANLPEKQVEELLWTYRDRYMDLARDPRAKYILIFKNHGKPAGASLEHPHSQLIATPIIPKRVMEEIDGSRDYYNFKERCGFCDIVRQELADQSRLVVENDSFIAFEVFASRFPFETWIMPKKHTCNFHEIERKEIMDLAAILKSVMRKMYLLLEDPPFNYIIHTAPTNNECRHFYHWHIEIMPRLTQVAGFEWGTGMYINPTVPEEAAKSLREVDG